MLNTLVFIDEGFLNKLSKHFGDGNYIRFNKVNFVKNLTNRQKLICKKIFYYTTPPFQSEPPTKEEELRKEGYDKFIKKLKEEGIIIREGRCQRLKLDGKFVFKQKSVDVLLSIDLIKVPLEYKDIQKVILITSDSDFIPAIDELKNYGVKVILYTYYEKIRNTNFSRSNDLIKSVYKYVLLSKQDFLNSPLLKKVKEEK